MSAALYQQAIKDLATAAHGAGRLAAADARGTLDNPLCGDRVSVELSLREGRIAALAHQTRGCLLCRAAASILGLRAAGCRPSDIAAVSAALEALLMAGDVPPLRWPELEIFAPVRRHGSRHGCVLLPFQVVTAALGQT